MKKVFALVVVLAFCFLSSGCVPLLIGAAAGGLGAYAVSNDTIEGDTDTPFASLWDAAVEIAKVRGTVKVEDYNRGYIEVDAKPHKIWIKLSRLTETATRVRVSSRKNHFPDLKMAQDVFVRIFERARDVSAGRTGQE